MIHMSSTEFLTVRSGPLGRSSCPCSSWRSCTVRWPAAGGTPAGGDSCTAENTGSNMPARPPSHLICCIHLFHPVTGSVVEQFFMSECNKLKRFAWHVPAWVRTPRSGQTCGRSIPGSWRPTSREGTRCHCEGSALNSEPESRRRVWPWAGAKAQIGPERQNNISDRKNLLGIWHIVLTVAQLHIALRPKTVRSLSINMLAQRWRVSHFVLWINSRPGPCSVESVGFVQMN